MKKSPCYGCSERTIEPNCHDTCERHHKWLAGNEKINKARRKDFEYYDYKETAVQKSGKKIGEK